MTSLSHRIRQVDPTKAALLCAILLATAEFFGLRLLFQGHGRILLACCAET